MAGSLNFAMKPTLLAMAAAQILLGCQKSQLSSESSSVASIDTLMSGKESVTRGRCGPAIGATPSLSSVWQSLPPRLKDDFPLQSGRLRVDAEAQQRCENEVFPFSSIEIGRGQIGSFETCWSPLAEESNGSVLPVVHLQSQPEAINTHLIAATTTTYFEFYVDDLFGPVVDQAVLNQQKLNPGETQVSNLMNDLRRARKLLAQAFIDDLKAAKRDQLVDRLSQKFRASSGVLHESIPLQNFIMAQMVDAYYCNSETVKQFNDNALIRTRGAFLSIVDFMGAPWYAKN